MDDGCQGRFWTKFKYFKDKNMNNVKKMVVWKRCFSIRVIARDSHLMFVSFLLILPLRP